MFKIKNNLLLLNIFVFMGLGLFLITSNNNLMAAPKKESSGKKTDISEINKSEEEKKKQKDDIRRFFELNKEFKEYSIEQNNEIIKILENPELMEILMQKAEKEVNSSKEKGSSSKQSDDSKK